MANCRVTSETGRLTYQAAMPGAVSQPLDVLCYDTQTPRTYGYESQLTRSFPPSRDH